MIDYFALLEQPRQPWLDLDELKKRYQTLALAEHPDQKASADATVDFAAVNEAYRCLRDPKLRLQHLIQLTGIGTSTDQTIPEELLDLFADIGAFVQTTDDLLQRTGATHNAIALALLRSEVIARQQEAEALLAKTRQLYNGALDETRSLNETWAQAPTDVAALFRRFSYLTRWIQQLEERQFQLSA